MGIGEIDAKAGLYHTWKGLNDNADIQHYNRDILTQLIDSFIQTIESQWAALSEQEKLNFNKSLVDLETEIENEIKRKNRKKRDGTLKKQVNGFMLFSREKKDLLTSQNPNWSKGEIKKRVDRLWKEVDPATKDLYRTKASQLVESTIQQATIPSSNNSIDPIMILGNNVPAPPPPTPTQEIGADDDEEADEGPTLVTLTCPVKRPITDLND